MLLLNFATASLVLSVLWPARAFQKNVGKSSLSPPTDSRMERMFSLFGLAGDFNVSFNSVVGESNCENGKTCVGIVLLAGLVETDLILPGIPPPDPDVYACPQFGKGTTGSVCNFLCGVLSNIAHHVSFFKRLDSDVYSFDVVLMHDMSVPQGALDLISALGARTLLMDDSIKRKSCRAYLARNSFSLFKHQHERPFNESTCDFAPFDHTHFTPSMLMMFLQQLKLGAIGLSEYAAIAHLDIDMFITNSSSITAELDYFFSKDMPLMAPMGRLSPLNAGHWIARPSRNASSLWLEAVTVKGFNSTHGWGNATKVVPDIDAAIRANTSEVTTRDWDFVGADRDQGLLYYVFAIELHGWYAEAPVLDHMITPEIGKRNLTFRTESQVRFTDLTFEQYDDMGIVHMCGVGKPWDDDLCLGTDLPGPRLQALRDVLPHIVEGVQALPDDISSEFVNNFCYPKLKRNAEQCSASASEHLLRRPNRLRPN